MTPEQWPGCLACKHFRRDRTSKKGQGRGRVYCAAFPQHIPMMFSSGEIAHLMPALNQDNDIVFEARDGNT